MASSSIPACKAAIVQILAARQATPDSALIDVDIARAMPTKDEDMGRDAVYVGDATNEEDWNQLGASRRGENYWISLIVYVEDWGDDPVTAETRLFNVWAEVTEALRDDLKPPGTSLLRTAGVLQYGRIEYRQTAAPASAEKWGARLDGRVLFAAHNV